MRTVKKPEIRKIELLKTAQELFFSFGYEKTSVQQITTAAGVAKGTFYHYFLSKEDLLRQLTDWQASQLFEGLQEKIESMEGDSLEKFQFLISSITRWKVQNRKMIISFMKVMNRDSNILLRHQIDQSYITKLEPLFLHVIEQGVKEGVFKVKNPKVTTEIFLILIMAIQKKIIPEVIMAIKKPTEITALIKKVKAIEDNLKRVLGIEKESFKLFNINRMKELLSK